MQNNKLPLEGEIALVTGSAGNGIGRATALTLAHQQIIEMGRKAIVCKADITSESDVKKMIQQAASRLGAPSIAVIGPGGKWTPAALTDIQIDHWEKNINNENYNVKFPIAG